jgi:hypothetical protein
MIGPAATLILPSEIESGIGSGVIGIYVWFSIALFFFPAVLGLGISYLMLRLKRKWRTTLAVWSLILFFPIYFGVFCELVERTSFLFLDYELWISSGSFGALLIGIQLTIAAAAWLIGYDWLRGKKVKLPENTVEASSATEKTETAS